MLFRSIGKCALVLSLLATTVVYAKDNKIPCPSVSKIQQAAQLVNEADIVGDGTYVAVTSEPAFTESKHSWFVGASKIGASSAQEAIDIAKASVQKASIQKNEYAQEIMRGLYACDYGPGQILAISMDEDSSMSPVQAFKKAR